ncbi:MAG: peptidoglycan DD-metalloendopeptidase family protein [Bacteroidia bacterium]|nr:peptidoglycan DD-metalloendopeptidase family protein [Bacteroidia bacterium]NNF31548.1 peptidoglycan DD-metalloendopeptidase family protein [Flavobacteriaceae bacterium]NNJ82378.1 peptidoglycan DD-metalloendopeptidase family protein [Flavobacteriaceae bacterium]NNM07704.1 peptidoglycan DD-metalloendopeptidase family protein [Flavobacteriaceae bacterium]
MMRLKFILTVLCCFVLASASVQGQSKKQQELEAKRQAILEEIKQINTLLFKTRGEKKSVLTQVEDLDQRIRATENLIRVTNQQANLLTREINDNLNKIEALREELKALKEDYAAMIKKSYKSKSQQSRVMFLLSSEDFLQAYKRLQYMKQYAKHRKEQGERIKDKTEELQALNTGLIEQKNQKQLLIDQNKQTRVTLAKEKKDQETLIASLRKDEGKFASQIRSKQREADAIDKQIDAIIKAAIAESNKSAGTKVTKGTVETFALTAEAKALAASFSSNKGKLPWPVEKGVVIRRYGNQRHPQLPNVTTFSSGVEIATEKNAKARAVFNGEVFQVQRSKQGIMAVFVRHGNYISVYYNLDNLLVKKGDKVTTKQEIGTIFTNGLSGKTVLKFLIYQNSTRMNPADWVYRM